MAYFYLLFFSFYFSPQGHVDKSTNRIDVFSTHAMPCPVALVEWFHASLLSVLQTCEDSNVELIVVVALFYCVLYASRICPLLLCHSWLIALPDHLLWGGAPLPDHSSQMLPKEKCRQCLSLVLLHIGDVSKPIHSSQSSTPQLLPRSVAL